MISVQRIAWYKPMKKHYLTLFTRFILGCSVLLALPVAAAQDEAMARAQFMIRQISAERDQLQTEQSELKKQVDALQNKLSDIAAKSSKSAGNSQQQTTRLQEDLLVERSGHEATRQQLESILAEKSSCTAKLGNQFDSLALCIKNNHQLYEINVTVLERYENKGLLDGLMQADPVSGISQIAIENMVDDTQYKLDDLRMKESVIVESGDK